MNAKEVAWRLATGWGSPFRIRSQYAVIPNVSWSMLPWEADLLVLSKAKFLTEVEIKVTMSDWKADLLKKKHDPVFRSEYAQQASMIKRFYYAAPEALALRFPEVPGLHEGFGVISVGKKIQVLREAANLDGFRKLDRKEVVLLLRLGTMKAWQMAHRFEETV